MSRTQTRRVVSLWQLWATLVALSLVLAGCTNQERGNPDGWVEIVPETVPGIAALVPEDLQKRGVLRMGTNTPFAPFEFKDSDGTIIGTEMDLGRALASVMGLEFEPVEQDFALILPSVSSGTVDVGGSGFTDTEERRQNYDFVNTLYAGIQWAQHAERDAEIDPEHSCGLTVAVQRNTVAQTDEIIPKSQACAGAGEEPIEILAYDTSDNAATAFVLGRADAFAADSPIVSWVEDQADGEIQEVGPMYHAAPYGFAVPKDAELTNALVAAMDHLIETGTYEEILDQWNIQDGLIEEPLVNEKPVEIPLSHTLAP
ncbi:ABC transporter substrate-binding protein [Auritidibacter ignavus]|uniref:ABC transporter substrate-binding protein n=1 Tax=Auritidibacter ignavus TaxID=678932 RepID=UPI002FE5D3D8